MLLRLYSDTDLILEEITFLPGINIIHGKKSRLENNQGINGIGKSSLVRLIDYLFLSGSAEKIFAQDKYSFLKKDKHTISIDFKIKNKSYTIKRFFAKKDEVVFGELNKNLESYSSKDLSRLLLDSFFPIQSRDIFFPGDRFGTLMSFFIRDDLENLQRIEPLNFFGKSRFTPNQRELYIYNLFLLNLPNQNVIQYDKLYSDYDTKNKTRINLENKLREESGKTLEEFRSERLKIEDKIRLLEESIKSKNFLSNYKDIENQIIELTNLINDKLKEYHIHNRKIRKVRDGFKNSQEIDLSFVKKMYNEVIANFGDLVKKTLDEVQDFKKQIIENRNRFLSQKLLDLENTVNKILAEIGELENKRKSLYDKLEEKGALESITNTYEELINEKANLEKNIVISKQIDDLQNELSDLDVKLSTAKKKMQDDMDGYQKTLDKLRELFQIILKNAIVLEHNDGNAYFDVKKITGRNNTQLPYQIKVEIPKADSLGQSRLKVIAYDLMVFFNSIQQERTFPRFLIHDGIFHGIARSTVVNVLNYIHNFSLSHTGFQYITTFNHDELYLKDSDGKLAFDKEERMIIRLEDNESKMIFKRAFK